MALRERYSRILAADTNVLLDLALERELVLDSVAAIRRAIPESSIVVPPTAAQELAFIARHAETPKKRAAARFFALHQSWKIRIIAHVVLGDDTVDEVAARLRTAGLIDDSEVNDSLILVEAASLGASILLTSDEHLRGLDFSRLKFELDRYHLNAPVIATPAEIVKKFLR
jgi:predicted nucleic acid-binding protein